MIGTLTFAAHPTLYAGQRIVLRTGVSHFSSLPSLRDCPRYSGGRYRKIEAKAAAAGVSIGETYMVPGYCRAR